MKEVAFVLLVSVCQIIPNAQILPTWDLAAPEGALWSYSEKVVDEKGVEQDGSCFSRAILFDSEEVKDKFLSLSEVPESSKLINTKTGEVFTVLQVPVKEQKEVTTGFTPVFSKLPNTPVPSP